MEAKWLQNGSLEASGRPLGADSASRGSPEPSWRGSGAARGCLKIRCWRRGGLLGRKVGRFHPPGGSPGGSRRGSGRSFWKLFCGGAWRNGKIEKQRFLNLFLMYCLSVLCVFLRLTGGAGASAHHEKPGFRVERIQNVACRPFSSESTA